MKNKNIIILWMLFISFLSVGFGYSLVFAGNLGEIEFKLSNNIFSDSLYLNNNKVIIQSRENLDGIIISGDCSGSGKLVEKNGNYYIFDVFLGDENCEKSKVFFKFQKGDLLFSTSFNITTSKGLYESYLDFSDTKLKGYLGNIGLGVKKLVKYAKYDKKNHSNKYDFLENNRTLQEIKYMEYFISDILKKRSQKYAVPIKGSNVSTQSNKLPNTGRPYRASYTDGIHEGWDFPAPFGENVLSIDYGIIVKIVDNFDYSDLYKIKYTGDLTKDDKAKNLDILRGKQVWIKTMKGDVVFYSHLNEVYSNIKVGDLVFKGQALGTVGITGVPDKNYSDYHLHIEFRKNPYNDNRKASYSNEEYLNWDWYFKGKSEKYILENQHNIFEKNEK